MEPRRPVQLRHLPPSLNFLDGGRGGIGKIQTSMDATSPTVPPLIALSPAVQSDAELLYALWDAEARRQSIFGGPTTLEAHTTWLKGVLGDPDVHLYVATDRGQAVGSGRLDLVDYGKGAVISVLVAKDARRRGLGTAIIRALEREAAALGLEYIRAEILEDNQGSRMAFMAAGYVIEELKDGVITMLRTVVP